MKRSYLEEELSKYEKARGLKGKRDGKGRKMRDEGDILAKMDAFKNKLKVTLSYDEEEAEKKEENGESGATGNEGGGEEGVEVDKDTDFLSHTLFFPKGNEEEVAKAEREYEVIDPRKRSAQAKDEERERKRRAKPRDGGRGYRR